MYYLLAKRHSLFDVDSDCVFLFHPCDPSAGTVEFIGILKTFVITTWLSLHEGNMFVAYHFWAKFIFECLFQCSFSERCVPRKC